MRRMWRWMKSPRAVVQVRPHLCNWCRWRSHGGEGTSRRSRADTSLQRCVPSIATGANPCTRAFADPNRGSRRRTLTTSGSESATDPRRVARPYTLLAAATHSESGSSPRLGTTHAMSLPMAALPLAGSDAPASLPIRPTYVPRAGSRWSSPRKNDLDAALGTWHCGQANLVDASSTRS